MNCAHCGTANPEQSQYCSRCGKEISVVPSEVQSNQHVGSNCPYCQTPIKPGVAVVICPSCRIPHHQECWRDNGSKCTTFGCSGKVQGNQTTLPPLVQATTQAIYPSSPPMSTPRQVAVPPSVPTANISAASSKKTYLWIVAALLIAVLGLGAYYSLGLGKPKGFIMADEVILRDHPSIGAKNVGELTKGEAVRIQEEWKSNDPNEAVIARDGLAIDYKGAPLKIQKGQAVVIDAQNGDRYIVRFNVDKQWVTQSLHISWVRKIAGDVWYRVRAERTGEGWVFGEFVRIEK